MQMGDFKVMGMRVDTTRGSIAKAVVGESNEDRLKALATEFALWIKQVQEQSPTIAG